MSQVLIQGTAEALSPIIHGGDRYGNITEFRRVKTVVDGRIEMIPHISGNSIRSKLRKACTEFNAMAAGIDKVGGISVYHLLFGGGSLEKQRGAKKAENYIDLQAERQLCQLLPALSIFGGSSVNRVRGGKIDVAEWVPLCRETLRKTPAEYHAEAEQHSIYDLLDVMRYTRGDPAKDRGLQRYVDEGELEVYLRQKEVEADAETKESGSTQQTMYDYEYLADGTIFYIEFLLRHLTELEYGTFLGGLSLFATDATIGGRKSSGLGKVRLNLKQVAFDEPVRPVSEFAQEKVELARQTLSERRDKILDFLRRLG